MDLNLFDGKDISHKSDIPFPLSITQILNINKLAEPDFRKSFRLPSIHVQHFCLQFFSVLRAMRLSQGRNLQVSLHILSTSLIRPSPGGALVAVLFLGVVFCGSSVGITYTSGEQHDSLFMCLVLRKCKVASETPFVLTYLPIFFLCC